MAITPEARVVFPLNPAPRSIDWPALASAWPDALAFAIGLAVARWAGWTTGDLIWSLWLSSLVVGYATILWMIATPAFVFTVLAWKSRNDLGNTTSSAMKLIAIIVTVAALALAFFTVHFVGFHYVHSGFLMQWFPIDVPGVARAGMERSTYVEVVRRYWVFLPSAFLSHRAVFLRAPITEGAEKWIGSFFSRTNGKSAREFFSEPYRNVLRMHGLIFFFGFAHFAGLENFAVYAVVYAVYFFPWRLIRGESSAA